MRKDTNELGVTVVIVIYENDVDNKMNCIINI